MVLFDWGQVRYRQASFLSKSIRIWQIMSTGPVKACATVLREDFTGKSDFMVLLGRMELPTSSLPMTRSTTELQQPIKSSALEHTPY